MLTALVERETSDQIDLDNGISIEVHAASFRGVRGYTTIGVICDEIAFWPLDDAADADTEILNALRPAMASVPGARMDQGIGTRALSSSNQFSTTIIPVNPLSPSV